jgi:hypothetical protein
MELVAGEEERCICRFSLLPPFAQGLVVNTGNN